MNCKAGDLAYVVAPPGPPSALNNMVVQVGVDGECELGTVPDAPAWLCRFPTPFFSPRLNRMISVCWVRDAWLRPISGVPVHDEQLDEVAI